MEQPEQHRDWYAVVLRRNPEIVLVVDRYSLARAWIVARLMFPELDSEDLVFRTIATFRDTNNMLTKRVTGQRL